MWSPRAGTQRVLGLIRHMTDVEPWFHGYDHPLREAIDGATGS